MSDLPLFSLRDPVARRWADRDTPHLDTHPVVLRSVMLPLGENRFGVVIRKEKPA